MIWLIISIVLIAILDTLLGNMVFPGKVGVVKTPYGRYKVYKYNRKFLIPIKGWVFGDGMQESFMDFNNTGQHYSYDDAMKWAALFAHVSNPDLEKYEEIWTNRPRKIKKSQIPSEDELTLQLGEACIAGDKQKELELMSKLKEYKYI